MDGYEVRHLQIIAEHDQIDAALVEADARGDVAAARDIVLAALRNGAYILCLWSCPREGCTCGRLWLDDGEHVRVPYGGEGGVLEGVAQRAAAGDPCLHCGVQPRSWHHIGCLFEMCPLCQGSVLLDCHGDNHAPVMPVASWCT
jgi:hypothetical protein